MRAGTPRILLAAILVAGLTTVVGQTASTTPSAEQALLTAINNGRAGVGKPPLVMHQGVRVAQRGHAQNMAAINDLTHAGAQTRHDTAAPDPSEANGPRDDGFTGSWCENVAMRGAAGESEAQVAAGFYDQWRNSPGHRQCMHDETNAGYNAAGVGVFRDGSGNWWAALMLMVDTSPPSGSGGGSPPPPTSNPGNPAPVFSSSSPCGGVVLSNAFGGSPASATVSASDSPLQQVTLSASGLPAWATFTSNPGNPATGTLTASPGILDWLLGLIGGGTTVTITATDNGIQPSSSQCSVTLRVRLFPGSPF